MKLSYWIPAPPRRINFAGMTKGAGKMPATLNKERGQDARDTK